MYLMIARVVSQSFQLGFIDMEFKLCSLRLAKKSSLCQLCWSQCNLEVCFIIGFIFCLKAGDWTITMPRKFSPRKIYGAYF